MKFDVSGNTTNQLADMAISISGFKFDVWRPLVTTPTCGTRGYDYLHGDQGNHTGHCKAPVNTNGKKTGHNK